ncbi:HAD superfamily hydrolase (TIGR01490 family) [Dysgonomonas alginatilytica]|uniref:HAD superfamily hydrolase (TIGR01490 family) n=1 Tax=Dysgonomonas alginatilytica TaxID=1605892 RepID=A0A2V3PRV4_9BACT|nr:HAD family hydrolase [Dysgonomonas alginatilytica]PXV67523.1 HAD superfamily hydrolase (TIGR01490 family) [Dysgonomonas alginatilytica]
MQHSTIAAFDFDGTITTKDTLFDFIRFYTGSGKLLKGLIKLSPTLILYKLGFIKNDVAKQKLFSYFFKNKNIDEFNKISLDYIGRIHEIVRPAILKKIEWHQEQNHIVIIVSASIVNWIKPWASEMGIRTVLSTEIEVKNNIIEGSFSSKNCYGQEKVNRLLAQFPNRNEYILYAYGDSAGDKELLALADYPTLIK